ncbi:MAG: EamA family transporter [Desulforegulaceae bacterium]|jgi:drug/metabolite transporter (DMT)-like permease|nr:EamA family transporter [Desulforegulaceae bacterium]
MKNIFFYVMTVLIWGSTWIAIKFQIDSTDPMVSIAHRFILASAILIFWCKLFKLNLKFNKSEYLFIALQGAVLFGINYVFIYTSELYLASGLTAVLFSTILIMNVIIGYFFLGTPIDKKIIIGAFLGMAGIVLVFRPEISSFSADKNGIFGIIMALTGTFLGSIGNILSARNQTNNLPVIQTNALGMGFGGILMLVFSVVLKKDISLVLTPSYLGALSYLAVFGSIAGFGFYLSLVGSIGPGRAAYSTLVFPLVALFISTIFEGYVWTFSSILGMLLILFGNLIIIKRKQTKIPKKPVIEAKSPAQAGISG